ncbi:hypothetical protein PF007_g21829 [Phytophthora fragariae]|uniref:Uncharacterized protein n=3 Tax=Phytophthora fragariae TaxID=53985 RepID=A0A6A3QUP4_9STRA|nr:hypothetical protein PF007_g21829 [Phytophthora fragariae]
MAPSQQVQNEETARQDDECSEGGASPVSALVMPEYVAVTEARCEDAKEDAKAVLRSVRNSFDESLLETMGETLWDVNKDDLTDDFLMSKIKEITTSFMNKELPDMNELFGEDLKFDDSISDVEARVTTYFHLANKIIMHNGVSELFVGDEGVKRKCKVLVKFLPASLHKAVSRELEYRSGEAKLSVSKLYTVVSERALEMEKETRALKRLKSEGSTGSSNPLPRRRTSGSINDGKEDPASVAVGGSGRKRCAGGQPKHGGQRPFSGSRPPKTCFYCRGEHEFISCPSAAEADKEAIRAKRRAEFKARQESREEDRTQVVSE